MMDNTKRNFILICAVLAGAIIIAYEPIRLNDFVNYDDYAYIKENHNVNKGFSWDSIIWAFKITAYQGNWHPLTWLSHMFDCQFFGLKPLYHHLHNVLLHIMTCLLLFYFLNKTTEKLWQSAMVTFIFAIHPLRVESVAWASERKDVLSIFFFMVTLTAYYFYTKKPNVIRYITVFACFILGLAAKPMLVTIPFVLLLLDYWPLNRLTSPNEKNINIKLLVKSFLEKIPLLALSIASCILTYIVQYRGGTMKDAERLTFYYRFWNALDAYIQYIIKTFYPVKLAVLYPHPGRDISLALGITGLAAVIIVSACAVLLIKKAPYLFTGWFFYLGTLIPVLGLVQVGVQAYADRYTYLPSIGIITAVIFGLDWLAAKFNLKKIFAAAAWVAIICLLIILTRNQVKHWQNTLTLFDHTSKVTKNNYNILTNLSDELLERKEYEKALAAAEKALALRPKNANAVKCKASALLELKRYEDTINFLNGYQDTSIFNSDIYNFWAFAYASTKNFEKAMPLYQKSIELDPNNFKAMNNQGLAFRELSMTDKAIESWQKSIEIKPDYLYANINLGYAFIRTGQFDKVIKHFEQAVKQDANQPKILFNLANAYAKTKNFDKAIETYLQALKVKPDYAQASNTLAYTYLHMGQEQLALKQYEKTLQIDANDLDALNQAAWLMATTGNKTVRNPKKALELAEHLCSITSNNSSFLDTLAAAYAANDNFSKAVETAQKAAEIAVSQKQNDAAEEIKKHLELFRQQKYIMEDYGKK